MRPLLLSLVLASGCMLANLTPQARFSESAHTVTEASRWGHVDMALPHVSPKYSNKFLSRHRDWGGAISIADAELIRLQVAEDRKSAFSEVTISWYTNAGMSLRTSVIRQDWETDHGKYRLVKEAVRSGDPTLFAEDEEPQPEG